MKTSKLASALVLALATTAAFAADEATVPSERRSPAASSGHQWYQANERTLQSEEQKARLEREGFPQYTQ